MKSLNKRVNEIEQSFSNNDKADKVTDISFIIPDQPVQQFGKTFDSLDDCLTYCDANDIEYTREKGPFGWDTYNFPNHLE